MNGAGLALESVVFEAVMDMEKSPYACFYVCLKSLLHCLKTKISKDFEC